MIGDRRQTPQKQTQQTEINITEQTDRQGILREGTDRKEAWTDEREKKKKTRPYAELFPSMYPAACPCL